MHKAYRRRFGVEIECGMDGGLEEAAHVFNFKCDSYGYPDYENAEGWTLHDDGSGVELGSPILEGEGGYAIVKKAMERLKTAGAFVTDYDGLHVHHDAPEFKENPRLLVPLVESWINNENRIRDFVSPRRHDRGACPRWRDADLDRLRMWAADGAALNGNGSSGFYFGRNDLNILALREHGTIEIRLLEGTLDADVAIAWIQFGQRLIHEVLQNAEPIAAVPTDRDLLSRIKLSPEARRILMAKQAAGHMTAGMRYQDWDRDEDDYAEDEW